MKYQITFILLTAAAAAFGQRSDLNKLRPAPTTAGTIIIADTTESGVIRYTPKGINEAMTEAGYTKELKLSGSGSLNRTLSIAGANYSVRS